MAESANCQKARRNRRDSSSATDTASSVGSMCERELDMIFEALHYGLALADQEVDASTG